MPPHYSFNVYAVPPAVTALALLLVGVVVLIRERASRVSVAFLFIMLAVSVWLSGLAGMYCATNEGDAIWWARVNFLGSPFIPSTIYLFSTIAMGIYARRKTLIWAGLLLSAFFSAAALYSDLLFAGVYHYWWGYYLRYGWLGIPFLVFFFGLALANLRDYWVEYRKAAPGTHKLRLRALLIAFSIAYLGGLDYLPCYGVPLYPFGYLPVFVCLALMARAIQRYRLVDIVPAFAANEILATMADPLAVCDADGRIRVVNQALCATLGYTQQELLGERIECLAGADSGGVEHLRQLLSPGTARNEEMVFHTKGGGPVAVRISLSPLQDRDCNRVGTVLIAHDIRERKRAEGALRESEEKHRTVLASIQDGYYEVDLAGNFTFFNDSVCRATGYPADELLGMNYRQYTDPEKAATLYEVFSRVYRTGEPQRLFDWKMTRKDGTKRLVEGSASLIRDDAGQPRGFRGVVRDATERRRVEEALRQSEERFRGAFDNAPIGMCLTKSLGRYLKVNRSLCEMLGYSEDELLATTFADLSHPDDLPLQWNYTRQLLAGEIASYHMEKRYIHKRGHVVWGLSIVSILRDADGAPLGFLVHIQDITQRKQAEEALRASEERYRELFENANDIIFEHDLDGFLKSVNRAGEQLTGYTREEWQGMDVMKLIAGSDHDRAVWETQRRIAGDSASPYELHLTTKKGREVTLEVNPRVLYRDGAPVAMQGICRDITERKRIERELQQAMVAAEAANRAKNEFLANVSHEIRTPMNGIVGMTDLTLNTPLTDEQREYLTMVKSSADSLLKVINDILDFAKVEAGKIELDVSDFLLRDCVGDTMKALALRAAEKGLELVCAIPSNIPDALVGDPGRLRQVLVNLVGNAIKFTARGEVVVRTDIEAQSNGAVQLQFSVKDTGIGIPADKVESIFKPFEQADSSTTRRYGGTGLGLAISAQLVELMGGRIWADSEVGRGSTFHFTARFGLSSQPVGRRIPAAPHSLLGLRALIVDDNATNRRILYETLTNWRMRATTADDGITALTELMRAAGLGQPYPLVLLDAQMPLMDGFELAARIKQTPELSGATIMMLSSADLPGDAARCRQLGVAAYLAKPIKQSELLNTILRVLGAPAAEAEQAALADEQLIGEAARPLRILVVEDNLVNQKFAVRLLEKCGHTVLMATNGRQAVDVVARYEFDVVLMDVQMPEMDGFEATAAIRERERTNGAHLPIIAMTADAMKGDAERCLAAGMDAYIAKPIRSSTLFSLIDRVVAEHTAVHPDSDETASAPASAQAQ